MRSEKIIRKWMLLAAFPAILLVSCSKDDAVKEPGGPTSDGGDIRFEIGFTPQTRVATDAAFNSTWEDGDAIGVFAVKRARSATGTLLASDNYIHNVKLTYNSANGSWSGPVYWPNDGDVLDFCAYYPYDDNGGNPAGLNPLNMTFNVKANQNGTTGGKSNYNLSDLLTASADNSGRGYAKGSTVSLSFSHTLAMVQVKIDNANGAIDPNELSVKLRHVQTSAGVNLSAGTNGTVTASGEKGEVTMYRVEQPTDENYSSSYTFRTLVPAQMAAKDLSICRIYNGDYIYEGEKLSAALNLTAANAELFTQKLPFTLHRVFIKAGSFQMGSPDSDTQALSREKPQHQVTLTQNFYMGKYQVTRTQYAAFLNAVGVAKVAVGAKAKHQVDGFGVRELFTVNEWGWTPKWNDRTGKWETTGSHPMLYVTWYGAKAFADWVGGTLPTEAQWEYACRAGTQTAYSFGDNADQLGSYALYAANKEVEGANAVGTKLPNPWNLYDMHGNVYEWCLDQWDGTTAYGLAAETDPVSTSGSSRILRGGSWYYDALNCRSAYRRSGYPHSASFNNGFRVAFP